MREIEAEVLIVGAGPAGASTSYFLSKHHIPHILIDKSRFPRDKICGDALSGKVVQELKRIDPTLILEIEKMTKTFTGSYGVRFVAPAGHFVDVPFKSDLTTLKNAPGYIAKRFDFDAILLNKIQSTYCTFLDNTELKKVSRTSEGFNTELINHGEPICIRTRLLVSSEGELSRVARELGIFKKEASHFCAGIRTYYSGVRGMHKMNFIELHFLPQILPGYLWIFPLPNGQANVGIGMLSSVIKKKNISLRDTMFDILKNHPEFKERFRDAKLVSGQKGWGLPLGSKKRIISGDNFILTGDAAALIDPFTGEGIGNAMISGRLAAETIAEAVKKQCYTGEILSEYDRKLYLEIGKELKLSHTLQRLASQKWLFNWVVKKAASNMQIRELITGMFEDIDMRSKLSNPAFYFRMLFKKDFDVNS